MSEAAAALAKFTSNLPSITSKKPAKIEDLADGYVLCELLSHADPSLLPRSKIIGVHLEKKTTRLANLGLLLEGIKQFYNLKMGIQFKLSSVNTKLIAEQE